MVSIGCLYGVYMVSIWCLYGVYRVSILYDIFCHIMPKLSQTDIFCHIGKRLVVYTFYTVKNKKHI
jgi:hypothetical protein